MQPKRYEFLSLQSLFHAILGYCIMCAGSMLWSLKSGGSWWEFHLSKLQLKYDAVRFRCEISFVTFLNSFAIFFFFADSHLYLRVVVVKGFSCPLQKEKFLFCLFRVKRIQSWLHTTATSLAEMMQILQHMHLWHHPSLLQRLHWPELLILTRAETSLLLQMVFPFLKLKLHQRIRNKFSHFRNGERNFGLR